MKRLLVLLVSIALTMSFNDYVAAQVTSDSLSHQLGIHLLGKYDGDQVILRWAPSTPAAWDYSSHFGYTVERTIIKRNGKVNDISSFDFVGDSILRPLPLEQWEPLVNLYPNDDYIKVAAQSLYGTRPEQEKSDPDDFLKRATEFQNLYTVNLLAAEFSAEAARASALRIEDKQVEKNAVYVYRVYSRTPANVIAIDTGYAVIHTDTLMTLPKIYATSTYEGEGYVEIGWDKERYKPFYSGYHVERSEDGGNTFQKITEAPVQRTAYKDSSLYVFADSIPNLYQPVQYRIYGISAFAEPGPKSEAMTLQSRDRTAPTAPYNIATNYLGGGRMEITWEADPTDKDIDGFLVSRSNEVDDGFVQLTPEPLPANQFKYIDEAANEMLNNYYFVGVVDTAGNGNVGFPKVGTIIDSIPPIAPFGLAGDIDTNGIVTLTWTPGPEPDLRGYFVHFANQDDHVFINKVGHPIQDTVWRDTIPLNVLTESIYYKVVAVDHRYNYSDFSDMIELKKPDLVAPDAPIFERYYIDQGAITLHWNNPVAKDLEKVILWKKEKGQTGFDQLQFFTSNGEMGTFIDKEIKQGKYYDYGLTAIDDAGLESDMVGVLSLRAFEDKNLPDVTNVNGVFDISTKQINVSWDWVFDENVRFVIYRSVGEHPYQTFKVVKGDLRSFKDFKSGTTKEIKYRIKVVGQNGKASGFSEEVVVGADD